MDSPFETVSALASAQQAHCRQLQGDRGTGGRLKLINNERDSRVKKKVEPEHKQGGKVWWKSWICIVKVLWKSEISQERIDKSTVILHSSKVENCIYFPWLLFTALFSYLCPFLWNMLLPSFASIRLVAWECEWINQSLYWFFQPWQE